MAARRTDKLNKQIAADYLETQSVAEAARRNGVAWNTARAAIDELGDIERKLEEKKEQNTQDILAYMEAQKGRVCELIDLGLEVLTDRMREAKSATEVTTAMGTLIDKFTRQLPSQEIRVTDAELTLSEKMEIIRRAAEEYGH